MGRFVFFNNEYSVVVDERKITNNSLQEIDRISNSTVSIESNQQGSWLKISDKVDSICINKKNINSRLLQLKENDLCIISFDDYTFCVLFCAINHSSSFSIVPINYKTKISVGRDSTNDVIIDHQGVSRHHLVFYIESNGNVIAKRESQDAPAFLNSIAIDEAVINTGDCISILNVHIYYVGCYFIVYNNISKASIEYEFGELNKESCPALNEYSSAPRIYHSVNKEKTIIDPPTPLPENKPVPFILSVGPAMTMALAMMITATISVVTAIKNGTNGTFYTTVIMAVSMLLGSVLWPSLLRRYNKKNAKKIKAIREEKYLLYLESKESSIKKQYEDNLAIMENYLFPSVSKLVTSFDSSVIPITFWERKPEDEDFLSVRLGQGKVPSDIDVQYTERRFSLDDDDLFEKAKEIWERYRYYDNAPISLSLRIHSLIGIFGNSEDREKILLNILSSVLFLHSDEDVKSVFIFNDETSSQRSTYIQNIPHVWNDDKSIRLISSSESETINLLTKINNDINILLNTESLKKCHYVIFCENSVVVEKTVLYQNAKELRSAFPVSFVFLSDEYRTLPKDIDAIVQCTDGIMGLYVKGENNNKINIFEEDDYDVNKTKASIKRLSSVIKNSDNTRKEIPDRCAFLDMFKVGNVKSLNINERWNGSESFNSLKTPIGIGEGGQIVQFDIHESFHGCHGLVAGTTGSGKSEFLQAYILSMMINYSPLDVNFMLVDFKGGDIAIPFLDMPHVSAVVSNLTKSLLYRAIVSLKAESTKRQKLLTNTAFKLGIDKIDINSYQKLYHEKKVSEPLPHLIIVVDEFAQFKNQHAEYMQSLIDIAQIGRSLGIHLILATQKPAGVVDGQIWSNSRFKICLKVADREDSKAVLQRDEAAYISNAGRAYLQVGYNELFTGLQAGYSRAKYVPFDTYSDFEDLTVRMIDKHGNILAEEKDIDTSLMKNAPTQISAIISELKKISDEVRYKQHPLWLPPLPAVLYLDELHVQDHANSICIPIGMMDIPSEQSQIIYSHNFIENGSIALYGASSTGKTTLIQSILYQGIVNYSQDEFTFAVIDMNGRNYTQYENTRNSVGFAYSGAVDEIDELLTELERELEYRKGLFADAGCNSFEEYSYSGTKKVPLVLVVVENYAKFRDSAYQMEDRMIDILTTGQTFGFYFIISTTIKSGIYYKVREQLSTTISFNMLDQESYRDIFGVQGNVVPDNVKGRALILHDGNMVEIQIALPVHIEKEADRNNEMKNRLSEYKLQKEPEKNKTISKNEAHTSHDNNLSSSSAHNSYRNTRDKYVSCDESERTVCVGLDSSKHRKVFINLDEYRRFFIASEEDNESERLSDLIVGSCESVNVLNLCGRENNLHELLKEIGQYSDKALIIIQDFKKFYDDISNENLDLFTAFIKKNQNIRVMTLTSDLYSVNEYRDMELFILLCNKADVTGFSSGVLNEEKITLFNSDFIKAVYSSNKTIPVKHGEIVWCIGQSQIMTYFREDE